MPAEHRREFRDRKRLDRRRAGRLQLATGHLGVRFGTDLSGSGLKTSLNGGLTSAIPCPGDSASTTAKVDWYGTVRGRAGWTVDRFFFYGTGGLRTATSTSTAPTPPTA